MTSIATNPQTRPILVRRLRKLLQVSSQEVSDEQLLVDTEHTLNRALIEADIAMIQFAESVGGILKEDLLLLPRWWWQFRLFLWIMDYQLTKTTRAAWRWSKDETWAEYRLQGLTPHQALKDDLHETGEDN